MSWDPTGDFTVFDGVESVTYRPTGGAPLTVAGVLREQQTTPEANAGAQFGLQPTDAPFNFPGPNLGGMAPAPGDAFTDAAGVGWTVMSVAHDALTDQYRIVGRRRRS